MQTLTARQNLKTDTPRVVSFEPSHSWLKRHDDEGTLIIQAGYVSNPSGRINKDDENPLVVDGAMRRWYGMRACEADHISPLYTRKENTAKDSFKACLRSTDHGKDLHVVVSHWDEDTAREMARVLKGAYHVVRNGIEIQCNVVDATPELEGIGAYYLCRPFLKEGKTLLIEIGHGTSEEWLIDETGFPSGSATEQLAVNSLVSRIGNDQEIKAACLHLGEQQANHDLITRALKTGTIGTIPLERWEAIKGRHVREWYDSLKGYVLKRHGSTLQNTANIIFSGGGAALVESRLRQFAIVPENPQTASVRGCYEHYSRVING